MQRFLRPNSSLQISSNSSLVLCSVALLICIFGQGEWTTSKTLVFTLDLRLERTDATGVRTSPRAVLIWQATPRTTLSASSPGQCASLAST